jgi:hypothetical protein
MGIAPPSTLFDEITDFLSDGPSVEEILAYGPSPALDARLQELMDLNSQGTINREERTELEEFVRMNHFLRMLKVKARLKLAAGNDT